jgi:hypothetical protein
MKDGKDSKPKTPRQHVLHIKTPGGPPSHRTRPLLSPRSFPSPTNREEEVAGRGGGGGGGGALESARELHRTSHPPPPPPRPMSPAPLTDSSSPDVLLADSAADHPPPSSSSSSSSIQFVDLGERGKGDVDSRRGDGIRRTKSLRSSQGLRKFDLHTSRNVAPTSSSPPSAAPVDLKEEPIQHCEQPSPPTPSPEETAFSPRKPNVPSLSLPSLSSPPPSNDSRNADGVGVLFSASSDSSFVSKGDDPSLAADDNPKKRGEKRRDKEKAKGKEKEGERAKEKEKKKDRERDKDKGVRGEGG